MQVNIRPVEAIVLAATIKFQIAGNKAKSRSGLRRGQPFKAAILKESPMVDEECPEHFQPGLQPSSNGKPYKERGIFAITH